MFKPNYIYQVRIIIGTGLDNPDYVEPHSDCIHNLFVI